MEKVARWQKFGNTPNGTVLAATVARQVLGLTFHRFFSGSRPGFRPHWNTYPVY